MSLLAEFAAPFEQGRPPAYNSAFLRFLRNSGFAPLEAALRECGKRRPPLYDEMAYILGRMGDTRRALTILLEVSLTAQIGNKSFYCRVVVYDTGTC